MAATDLTADKVAIADVCSRYAIALDSRDWPLLRSCFTADVVGHYGGREPIRGYDAIEQMCRTSLERLTMSQHLVGTILVDVRGDEAHSTCYVHAQHVRLGIPDGDQFIYAGRYVDRLVRTADGWRIADRRLEPMWESGNARVLRERT